MPKLPAEPIKAGLLQKQPAFIHTASIDVKIMRLEKRQVTMAVFRQLDEELIFMSDGSLRGTPWGRVNYLWKDNQPGTAFHVVYQIGNKLKRSPVPREGYLELDALRWTKSGYCHRSIDWFYDKDKFVSLVDSVYERRGAYYPEEESLRISEQVADLDCAITVAQQRSRELAELDQLFIAT